MIGLDVENSLRLDYLEKEFERLSIAFYTLCKKVEDLEDSIFTYENYQKVYKWDVNRGD